jgi:SAM-dependent methyltransferase
MTDNLQSLTDWFETPPGHYLLGWEQDRFDLAVADVFGFNAVQLGLPQLATLRANRMPHRWLALHEESADANVGAAFITDAAALPFPEASLDLVVLPHTLEFSADPHHVLREVERVLVPEGRVVISGFNPASLWGLRQGRARLMERMGVHAFGASRLYLPESGAFIGPWRLRDWLRLLGMEIETQHYGCYRPAVRSDQWLQRHAWMDRAGARWWPILGAVHFIVAVKRVRGMRVLGPAWKPRRARAAAPVSIANRR